MLRRQKELEYRLIASFSVLDQLFNLERYLFTINAPFPEGIYSRYRFYPILRPGQEVFVVDKNNKSIYKTYEDLIKEIANYDNSLHLRSFENDTFLGSVGDIALSPILPIRAHICLKYIIDNLIMESRRYLSDYKIIGSDDAIYEYVNDILRHIHKDEVYNVIDNIQFAISNILVNLLDVVNQRPWDVLIVESTDCVFNIFSRGDYRIDDWMQNHDRKDY